MQEEYTTTEQSCINKNIVSDKCDITNRVCLYFDKNVNSKLSFQEMLQHLCFNSHENNICMDCRYFKLLVKNGVSVDVILNHIMLIVHSIMKQYKTYIFHVNFKSFSVGDIDKYKLFMVNFSNTMDKLYPSALDMCYIYNPSFIFSAFYSLFDMLISKTSKSRDRITILR
jgi:hypothetical protein